MVVIGKVRYSVHLHSARHLRLNRATAEWTSAEPVPPGKSHYWMNQAPDAVVELTRSFWSRLDH
ncbi:hypothetical protein [Umezawaea tangerina]|uniref:Uncharacterized protein n=1 Tax=Umezawaea tangerina TaxID=84725 RepID=A0A2T0SZQ6_9PSEU|nr:hypothetical protein [Umezawaea tangerina]PRY38897.1 hypothetical protein CLV43_108297 [Umezawaea tangerina]